LEKGVLNNPVHPLAEFFGRKNIQVALAVIGLMVLIGLLASILWPLVQQVILHQRSLGKIKVLSGPTDCDGQACYQLSVSCPGVAQTEELTLKIGEPMGDPISGSVLFATGWDGTYYWDSADQTAVIIQNLRAAGYRTIQMKWAHNWFKSRTGLTEGMAKLACRPATVAQWVYQQLHGRENDRPFCAVGHSNGASQFGYAVTQYGEYDLFSAVIFESGPNWSRIDSACLHDDPVNQALFADQDERNTIDWGFGFENNGSGACAQKNRILRSNFRSASLAFGSWPYSYPELKIGFIFGGDDSSTTAAQGMYYHDLLIASQTPNVTLKVVPGAPHFVTETPEGTQAIEDTIIELCQ
jgi:pimeloyl-ACP methyl ester carboxylesterase